MHTSRPISNRTAAAMTAHNSNGAAARNGGHGAPVSGAAAADAGALDPLAGPPQPLDWEQRWTVAARALRPARLARELLFFARAAGRSLHGVSAWRAWVQGCLWLAPVHAVLTQRGAFVSPFHSLPPSNTAAVPQAPSTTFSASRASSACTAACVSTLLSIDCPALLAVSVPPPPPLTPTPALFP